MFAKVLWKDYAYGNSELLNKNMIFRKYLFGFFLLLFFYCCSVSVAFACSCGSKPTILSQFEHSKDVFIAKITSVEKTADTNPYLEGIRGAKAIVQKTYKGKLKVGEEIFFEQGVICSWTFNEKSIGYEMLVYSSSFEGNPKSDSISFCSRNSNIQNAADDLLYLDNLEKSKGRSRISGTITYRQESALEGIEPIKKTLEGHTIKNHQC